MKASTLFSGIGAPEVSASWADWRWSADIDDFANAVRAHHWPEVPNLGDVAAIRDPEPVDLIVFGSPCQSFSVAGKRLGLADPRGNMALVALALVARLRPRWFVFENVPGLLSSDGGRDFGAFLGAVDECGYQCAWRVLDAQFAGVPQRRRRVFLVGYLGDWRPPAAVLFEPESLRWNPPPRREAGEGAAGGFEGRATVGRWPAEVAPTLNAAFGDKQGLEDQHALCGAGHFVAHTLRGDGFDAGEDGTGRGTPLVAFSCKDHAGDAGDISPTGAPGHDPVGTRIRKGSMVRRLTPRECERLQGFPSIIQRVRVIAWPDHIKCPQPAGAASPCTTEPSNASNAGGGEWWQSANVAEILSSISPRGLGARAVLHARITLDHADHLKLSVARYGLNASTAVGASASLPSMRAASIAQAAALIRPIREARTETGKAGSLPTDPRISPVLSGGLLVHLSGPEISALANDADRFTELASGLSMSITSGHGLNAENSGIPWTTWSSFVAGAIAGCIPGGMPSDCFLVADVEVETGFTDIPWRGGMAPDGRRYKALGNSMAVPVIGWILDRIRKYDALSRRAA